MVIISCLSEFNVRFTVDKFLIFSVSVLARKLYKEKLHNEKLGPVLVNDMQTRFPLKKSRFFHPKI